MKLYRVYIYIYIRKLLNNTYRNQGIAVLKQQKHTKQVLLHMRGHVQLFAFVQLSPELCVSEPYIRRVPIIPSCHEILIRFPYLILFYKMGKNKDKPATLNERGGFALFRVVQRLNLPAYKVSVQNMSKNVRSADDHRVQCSVNLDVMVLQWKDDCKCARKAISGYSRGLAARLINLETLLKLGVTYPCRNHITDH